jgi:hypothetical protein
MAQKTSWHACRRSFLFYALRYKSSKDIYLVKLLGNGEVSRMQDIYSSQCYTVWPLDTGQAVILFLHRAR